MKMYTFIVLYYIVIKEKYRNGQSREDWQEDTAIKRFIGEGRDDLKKNLWVGCSL